jgi:hypothetical protein
MKPLCGITDDGIIDAETPVIWGSLQMDKIPIWLVAYGITVTYRSHCF